MESREPSAQDLDPYPVPGDTSSGLVPGVHGGPPGNDGEGDRRLQAYCYRMCMSNVAKNRVPFPKPRDYDEKRYELLFRNFEAAVAADWPRIMKTGSVRTDP